jgi:5-methylcytosine-specific restriction protein A
MARWPYDTPQWARLRSEHLEIEPWCRMCRVEGRRTPADTVDHIVPISAGGAPFPGHGGLASYCHRCHSAKTARGTEAGAARTTKPRRGCNPDGTPLDPAHPWHHGRKSLRTAPMRPHTNLETQLDQGDKP